MFNPKTIITCSAIGFALSFIIGLFYSNPVGQCFVNALLYGAVLFGILGAGVSFIYQKFLSVKNDEASPVEGESSVNSQSRGTRVDITLDDDVLPEDEDSPKFYVNSNKTGIAQSSQETVSPEVQPSAPQQVQPVQASENVQQTAEAVPEAKAESVENAENVEKAESGFVPVPLGSKPEQTTEAAASPAKGDGDLEALDALPDIGALTPEADSKDDEEESENFVSDSDFATAGSSGGSYSGSSGQPMEQNAALMAKAISTALARKDD